MTRKALLIGINYMGSSCELRGCINDVLNIKRYIMSDHGFQEGEIKLLTEASDNPANIPTRENILKGIAWLVEGNGADSKLVMHYSGHGGWIPDTSGDEKDGRDETICPVDYERSGDIVDDELRVRLINPLKEGAELFCLFDCCHSGTILDLGYGYLVDTKPESTTYSINIDHNYQQSKGKVVIISGCQDKDTSSDAYIQGKYQGAMTYSLLKAVDGIKQSKKQVTYQNIMKYLLLICKQGGFRQIPQLSSGNFIDLSHPFILGTGEVARDRDAKPISFDHLATPIATKPPVIPKMTPKSPPKLPETPQVIKNETKN